MILSTELAEKHMLEVTYPLDQIVLDALSNEDWKAIDQHFLDECIRRIDARNFELANLLEVPRKPERRTMVSGNELFAITGRIVNPTSETQRVPDILAELRDAQGRKVYGWTIAPPKRTIAPKSSLEFNSAEVEFLASFNGYVRYGIVCS